VSAIRFVAPGLLALAVFVVYANALRGPWILDDRVIVVGNQSIRSLWHLGRVLHPPREGVPVEGRPLFNLTLAINYALGGEKVWGYHLFNVALHALNVLLLYGLVRRTLRLPSVAQRFAAASRPLAFAVALLWAAHPLATAAVDYVSQRSELLTAACYLLTLYCLVRSSEGRRWVWQGAAVVACAAGMASKEVMASAPLVALLYDRVFLSESWKECFRRRGWLYGGLAATWGLLAVLVIGTGTRGDTAGFGGEISAWHYALTQCVALVTYLKLSIWPSPLIFDYGSDPAKGLGDVWMQAVLVLALLVGVGVCFRRWPWVGFLGVMWFAVLAPSSSFVPIHTQTIAEHRSYLPLAAVVTVAVIGAFELMRTPASGRRLRVVAVAVVVLVFGGLTMARNRDYRTSVSIWSDTLAKRPTNARAWNSRGNAYHAAGDDDSAIADFTECIRLKPAKLEDAVAGYNNRGNEYAAHQRYEEAIADFTRALQLYRAAKIYHNRAAAYLQLGRFEDAVNDFGRALELTPPGDATAVAEAYSDRGSALAMDGRRTEAIADFTEAIRRDGNLAIAWYNRGNIVRVDGHYDQCIADCTRALELKPDDAMAFYVRGLAYTATGRVDRAIADYDEAVRLKPELAIAYSARGASYMDRGDYDKAWADARRVRELGGASNDGWIKALEERTGRSE
jgi:tetratricopeptide (TPR) repeat protein/4-amino-4-deoxy-L-arabinose transferase-like glycosyltransferase